MASEDRTEVKSLGAHIFFRVILAPWYLIVFIFRLLYRFHVENPEKLPSEGPYILCMKEPSLMGMFPSGYIAVKTILPMVLNQASIPLQAYMRDQLFALGYFEYAFKVRERYGFPIQIRPLTAHAAGKQALYLLEGLRCLQKGGLILMNPEGIPTWDGLPVPIGKSTAWLALHSGAPIYPAICSMGAYEIWPSWQKYPSLRGYLSLRIGDPIILSEEPLKNITDNDLDEGAEKILKVPESIVERQSIYAAFFFYRYSSYELSFALFFTLFITGRYFPVGLVTNSLSIGNVTFKSLPTVFLILSMRGFISCNEAPFLNLSLISKLSICSCITCPEMTWG